MDLGLLYSNFVMDNKDLTLHTTVDGSGAFRDVGGMGRRTAPSGHLGTAILTYHGIRYQQTDDCLIREELNCLGPW